MKKLLWLALCGMMVSHTFAQREIISRSSIENRSRIISEIPKNPEKEEADRFAKQNRIPFREIDNRGRVKEIKRIDHSGQPTYYGTHNIDAASTVSTNRLWNIHTDGFNLRGENILVGVWDGGLIRTTHVEFGSRAYSMDSGLEINGHTTHVAGTIGAAGVKADAIGMANRCYIEGYDWNSDHFEMQQAAKDGLLISNHSYGFIHGFDYDDTERRWEWHGTVYVDTKEDYKFGFYNSDARIWDEIAYTYPQYLIVKSAGNDRMEGPVAGGDHYVWTNGWQESNEVRDKDGGPDGFDCIGSQGTSKNILTVGAVSDVENGYEVPEDVVMTSYSSFGPTDDGRIKPDIVGNGTNLYSAFDGSDNDYEFRGGTSMAAPNVSGSLALLQELYFKKYDRFMKSSTLKGLVLHTADDAGNPGPDYKFGWGLLNTLTAATFINNDTKVLLEDSIADQTVRDYRFYSPGDSGIRITLCWTDPMGPILFPALDPKDTILINDLDIRLIRLIDSTVYKPYILYPETPDSTAQTGDNFRDNIEQIYLPVAENGYYDLHISHKDSIRDSVQNYSLIAEGVQPVSVAADSTYMDKNNGIFQVTDAPEYPLSKRFVWLIEPQSQQPVNFYFTDFSTDINDSVIIYDGPDKNSNVIGSFSGALSNPDTLVTSTGGSLFIEFSTGMQEGFKGFASKYCTTPPQEKVIIQGKENPCILANELYFFQSHPESEYQWMLSANVQNSAMIDQNSVNLLVSEGPFNLTVIPINRCGTGDASERTINPSGSPPDIAQVMYGDTTTCTTSTALFWVEQDSVATYEWVLPDGWMGSSDSSSIWITPNPGTGTIGVIPRNQCGESERIELIVNPGLLPAAPVIESERTNPCENSIHEFHIQMEDEVDYTWHVESDWEILGPDSLDLVTVKIGTGPSGKMYLTSTNRCGVTETSRNFIIASAPVPPVLQLQSSSIEALDEIILENYSDFEQVNWFRNDSLIPDFHGEFLIPQRNGVYSVDVANSQGCWVSASAHEQIVIEDESFVYNISTGTDGMIQVANDSKEPAVIQVFDLTGRMVFSNEVLPGTNLYHTTRLGLLIFRIEGSTYQKTQMVYVY